MTPEKIAYALQLFGEPDHTMTSIAKLLGEYSGARDAGHGYG
jgi:hypothetical protein